MKTNLKERHNFVRPLRKAGLTHKEVLNLGFGVSDNLWKSCLNEEERNLGGGCSIDTDLKSS